MIQGGGLSANMQQKPARGPINNEGNNGLKNHRGTVAMARSNGPHSSTSQFFINTANNALLDYKGNDITGWGYCVFGKVVEGMDIISTIENLPTITKGEFHDVPANQVIIKSVKVENNSQQSNSATSANNERSDISNNESSSVFASNNSNIYHKSNCPELGTKDLIEFSSPKKAHKSGGVPCSNCNPSVSTPDIALPSSSAGTEKLDFSDIEAKQTQFYGRWRLTRYAPVGKSWRKHDWGEDVMQISRGGSYKINGSQGTWFLNPDGNSLTLKSKGGRSRNTVRMNGDSIELTDHNGGRYTYVLVTR